MMLIVPAIGWFGSGVLQMATPAGTAGVAMGATLVGLLVVASVVLLAASRRPPQRRDASIQVRGARPVDRVAA